MVPAADEDAAALGQEAVLTDSAVGGLRWEAEVGAGQQREGVEGYTGEGYLQKPLPIVYAEYSSIYSSSTSSQCSVEDL